MILPRHWARAESEARQPDGKTVPFAVWRWSESSLEEARERAREAAKRIAARIRGGEPLPERYAYGERPVREEVIREHRDENGELALAVTRNVYGALILNTARVMFVDVDIPRPGPMRRFGRWLKGLFGSEGAEASADPEEVALERLRAWVAAHSGWAVRVYRTRAGLRYLVTHTLFEPTGREADDVMDHLDADPRYRALCRVQESFRARLTPKPWRCGGRRPPARYPYDDPEEAAAMRAWVDRYAEACEGWSTCALLEALGTGEVHPAVEPVRRVHDEMTGVGSGLPLA